MDGHELFLKDKASDDVYEFDCRNDAYPQINPEGNGKHGEQFYQAYHYKDAIGRSV